MNNIVIPPEAQEALSDTVYHLTGERLSDAESHEAIRVMLRAWPKSWIGHMLSGAKVMTLPLLEEPA